jgi:SAM-dependent methyltransferase
MRLFGKWMQRHLWSSDNYTDSCAPPLALNYAEAASDVLASPRNRFVESEDTTSYRSRLIREITAEGVDCVAAYRLIADEISKLGDPNERLHASHHEVRYLTTYAMTPPGPGTLVDIAASQIYGTPLKALKKWTIQSIPALAFDYETDRLPFANESVDGVLICEVLEHFALDPLHCFIEINRILKLGGFVVLTTPNVASWFSIYRALNYEHPSRWPVYTLNAENRKNHIHAREYLPSEVELLLEGAGFGNMATITRDYAIDPPHRPIEGFSTADRGETIFSRAYKVGSPKRRSLKPLYLSDVDFTN